MLERSCIVKVDVQKRTGREYLSPLVLYAAGRIQMGQGRPFGRRLTFPVFGSVIVIRKIRIHPGRSSGGFNGQAIGHLHYWTCIKEVDALHLPCKSWVQGTRFTRVVLHRCYDGQGSYPLAVFT